MELLECGSCGNLAIGHGEISCCDHAMAPLGDDLSGVPAPSLDGMLRSVFGMTGSELDVCLCVMAGGEQTVADLADRVDYDRSVVSRHLNHLAELGVVTKRRRIRKAGGHVYVYAPNAPDEVRRSLLGSFLAWVGAATAEIDALSREKVEAIVDAGTDTPQWRIYQD